VPEVVLAKGKTAKQTVAIAQRLLERIGRVLISRVPPDTLTALQQTFADTVEWMV
jgi:NCAIR mutase (PurE)-related protein